MSATSASTSASKSAKTSATTSAKTEKIVSPTFVLAWLVNFAQFMVFYLLVTTMALYAVQQFQASDTAGGFASSSFVVGATFARMFSGYIVDAMGHKRTLLFSLVAVAISCALYFPAQSLPLLIVVRILHGVSYAVASTAIMAVAQSLIPSSRRAEGTGYFTLGVTLATALGPATGLALSQHVGYSAIFVTVLSLSVVALGLGLLLKLPEPGDAQAGHGPASGNADNSTPRKRFSLASVIHPKVAPIGSFMLLVGVAYAGVITYLNAYSEANGLMTGASLFFLAYAGVSLVMRFILGRVQDARGDNAVIYMALVSFVAGLALLACVSADWQVVVAGALVGLGYGSLMPAVQAISVRLVDVREMGAGISTMFLLMDVGVGFGPLLLGLVVTQLGFSPMYWLLAGLTVVAAGVYFAVHGRKPVARADYFAESEIASRVTVAPRAGAADSIDPLETDAEPRTP
ncbi:MULTISPECIES: MFS transporter [Corynebacterium]|uniref:MFS transporter n=1 Tax=Corynebacterium TaxID=1716 RepID=UPI001CE49CF5|nr:MULTISPECIES: MFS transporter [Corynebacterium]